MNESRNDGQAMAYLIASHESAFCRSGPDRESTSMSKVGTASRVAPTFSIRVLIAIAFALAPLTAARADDAPSTDFKFTLGAYKFSENGTGIDANLRHSSDYGNTWIGYFRAPKLDANQWRGGWDKTFGESVRVQPSVQVASGGFVGGSLNIETGNSWFAGAGFGRTNLRPYFNLNFDPNDSWMLAGGYRAESGQSFAATYIRDNRENPDQQHLHLISRTPLEGKERLTLDLLYKRGLVDGQRIAKVGGTVTYDWPRFFARLAFDPNTNFTSDKVWRFSVGARF